MHLATHSLSVDDSMRIFRRRPYAEHCGEPLPLRADAALEDLPALGQDADLAFHLVSVDANIVHGWPPPFAAHDRVHHCGASATTRGGGQPLHPICLSLGEACVRAIRVLAADGYAQQFDDFNIGRFVLYNLDPDPVKPRMVRPSVISLEPPPPGLGFAGARRGVKLISPAARRRTRASACPTPSH